MADRPWRVVSGPLCGSFFLFAMQATSLSTSRQHRVDSTRGSSVASTPRGAVPQGPFPAGSSAQRALSFTIPVFVFIAAAIPFYPALFAEFVNFDDGKLYLQNDGFRGFDGEHLRWMFTTTYMGHYQPLTWLSAAIDYKISGTHPASYHRTNLLLHALNAVLLYLVAIRLLSAAHIDAAQAEARGTQYPATVSGISHPASLALAGATAALLFAVHPLRVESVAWVSERRDVLSTFFLLGSLLAYLRAVHPMEPRLQSLRWYFAACGLLVLSLLSKAWGMSFFVVVALLNVYPLRRLPTSPSSWLRPHCLPVLAEIAPLALLGVLAAIMAGVAQADAYETMKSLSQWGPMERTVQVFYGLAFYVWKTLWPAKLAVLYELPRALNPLEFQYLVSIAGVLAACAVLFLWRRRHPALVVSAMIYAVLLAPVLGIAQSGPQFVAERYSYVSCMSGAVLAGGGLLALWNRFRSKAPRVLTLIASLAVCILLGVLTWKQSRVWTNSRTLWSHAIEVGIPSARAHLDVGTSLLEEGRTDDAIPHFREAVRRNPDHGSAWYYLGQSLQKTGAFEDAAGAFESASRLMLLKHTAYVELADLYKDRLNRLDDAIAAYRSGIEAMKDAPPKTAMPRLFLGLAEALRIKGDIPGAKAQLLQAAKYKSTKERAIEGLRELGVEIRERPAGESSEE